MENTINFFLSVSSNKFDGMKVKSRVQVNELTTEHSAGFARDTYDFQNHFTLFQIDDYQSKS